MSGVVDKVTIQDIARQAGVSVTTVSAALHGRGRVSLARGEQIRALAQELRYEPHAAAQWLRASRTRQIGLILAVEDPANVLIAGWLGPMVGHVMEVCRQRGLGYVMDFHFHKNATFVPPQHVTSRLADGSLLIGDVGEKLRIWLAGRAGYPWVSVEEPADVCVLTRSDDGIYAATLELHKLGHRRMAYAGGPPEYTTHRLGLAGFRRALREAELSEPDPGWFFMFDDAERTDSPRAAYEWARRLLVQRPRPTAVICHGEALARPVILAAAGLGLSVPRDLSVFSFGPAALARCYYPCLSTIELDLPAMADQAMSLLDQMLQGKLNRPTTIWIAPRLVAGDSIAPPGPEIEKSDESSGK